MQYAVIVEHSRGSNYSAYVPDLPGCVATGDTMAEVIHTMRDAIEFHLEGMREDGLPVPESTTSAVTIEVAA
jgi:predicted RNase H-like HicB family nuclease